MSSAPTAEEIARDATWLAQAIDPAQGLVRLVAMDDESYRAASFLDDRLLQTPVDAEIVSWTLVEQATEADLRSDARWIFHIGHVGSTLISRLLGAIDGVLALREPRYLRDLALAPANFRAGYMAAAPKLMSRTFAETELACVKATSFTSEIAPELVPPGERALFVFATPRNYIATILAGPNSVEEMRRMADARAQRLGSRALELAVRNNAELAAAAWAAEMTSLEAAAEAMSDRHVAWADFDAVLDAMEAELTRIAEFFGFDATALPQIIAGPMMTRYSKAPEHAYSASLRRLRIGEAIEHNRRAIDAALAMLDSAAEESPLLARALARAGGN